MSTAVVEAPTTRSTVQVEDVPVIEMVEPLPGFPQLRDFHLEPLDEQGTLFALRSVEEPSVRLLVVPVHTFFPHYAPRVDDETIASLGITPDGEMITLGVVNPGDSAGSATVNLLAPVLVNVATRQAGQIVLDEDLPLRAPLFA